MSFLGLSFLTPLALAGLILLPVIYWLLKVRPPQPRVRAFPPLRLLKLLSSEEQQSRTTPWWLLLLRLLIFTLIILAAAQPFYGQRASLIGERAPVLILIDDSWAAAKSWEKRLVAARLIAEEATRYGSTVRLMTTASTRLDPAARITGSDAIERIAALQPTPLARNEARTIERLMAEDSILAEERVIWLTDGLATTGGMARELSARFGNRLRIIMPQMADMPRVITAVNSSQSGVEVIADGLGNFAPPRVILRDDEGRVLSEGLASRTGEAGAMRARFDIPVAVQNRISRIELEGENHAGGVWLRSTADARIQVALVTGDAERPQPLLSARHYLSNAFGSEVDVISVRGDTLHDSILEALATEAGVIVMFGTGPIQPGSASGLQAFLDEGGTLIRFADSALPGRQNDGFLPGRPHTDLRVFGGQLSWGDQPGLASFGTRGVFSGLEPDNEVAIRAQLLTRAAGAADEAAIDVIATLTDGTPLISMRNIGDGHIVFFHISADPVWSNLPASPLFARMLQRLVRLSTFASSNMAGSSGLFAPHLLLDGAGQLREPGPNAVAVDFSQALERNSWPGLYGPEGINALNLMQVQPQLSRMSLPAAQFNISPYPSLEGVDLRPHLIALAALLFLLDTLIMAMMSGRLGRRKALAGVAIALFLPLGLHSGISTAHAEIAAPWEAALHPRLAYVQSGNPEFDQISERAMFGLSMVLTRRTALEVEEPVGLDPDVDDFGYFPFIYWAVPPDAMPLSRAAQQNLSRFLANGGTVLFDTRDQNESFAPQSGSTSGALALQRLLENMRVPQLQPVPEDHVLTRTFYLISQFPGRYQGSPLWTEVTIDEPDRLTRTGDGVASVIITANDMAGAWAMDNTGRALLPVQPGGEYQREMAFRAGVNIVMYAFTGNYKADQVHVPDILRRLGQ